MDISMVCFPSDTMDISILREILRGGLDKMQEAEVTLVGGHSVIDPELKYGLSVTGVIHPEKIVTNSGAKVGDKLILTKPLGTGIINTAIKGGMASKETIARVTAYMAHLNKKASELMQAIGAHACTDITGFGLLGHACEVTQASNIGIEVHSDSVPIIPETIDFAQMGLVPGGTYRNKEFFLSRVEFAANIPDWMQDILFDAQTSGGLLISIPPQLGEQLLAMLHEAGEKDSAIIGTVIENPKGKIVVS
jgi:selenide,water dikinase